MLPVNVEVTEVEIVMAVNEMTAVDLDQLQEEAVIEVRYIRQCRSKHLYFQPVFGF